MTREEAFKILSNYQSWRRYDGPIGDGPEMQNPTELGKAIDVAIEVLSQLSLPSHLDEAAWKYADATCFDDPEFTATMLAFKAGAEWMAGQGETIEGEIVKDINNRLAVTAKGLSCKELKFGETVIVQIRKKQ